jgi:hypothetical protein
MSQLLSVELPEDVYERVRRAAAATNQPMETTLAAIVRGATPSLDKVPRQYRAELEAMEVLGDDELAGFTQAGLSAAKQRRLAHLLDKKQQGDLTNRQQSALAELQSEADRLMLRRAYAALLLKYRGHQLPSNLESPR